MSTQGLKINNKPQIFTTSYLNISVLLLCLVYLALNHDVLKDLYHKSYAHLLTAAYSHGPLVAIIVLYILYKKITELRGYFNLKPSAIGFILLLGSQTLLFLADISGINFLQHILLVVSLLAVLWSLYSYNIVKHFFLPALMLSLTFPVWWDAAIPLQKVSVVLTNIFLSITGIPYYHLHEYFHFPNGIIEIAPECAGLQQVVVSLIIGLLFAMQHKLRAVDMVKTLIYISIISILINTFRILIIMIIGYFTKMESSLISQHSLLGWGIYGIGIFLFLFFYSRVQFKPAMHKDLQNRDKDKVEISNRHGIKFLALILVLLVFPSVLMAAIFNKINDKKVLPIHYELTSNEWHQISDTLNSTWKPSYPDGDSLAVAEFTKQDTTTVYLYISRYAHLRDDVEPVNMDHKPYNPKYWSASAHEEIRVARANGHIHTLLFDKLVSKNNQRLDVLTYYLVNGKVADNLVRAKLDTLVGLLKLQYDIKVVCLAVNSTKSEGINAKDSLLDFYKHLKIGN